MYSADTGVFTQTLDRQVKHLKRELDKDSWKSQWIYWTLTFYSRKQLYHSEGHFKSVRIEILGC